MYINFINIRKKFFENHFLIISGLFVLITIIIVIRSFNAVIYPILHCEDGTEMLAYYFNNPSLLEIFRFYNGYIALLPNTIGFFSATIFPLHIAPYIMVAFSVFLTSFSLSIFSLRRYRFIMPDDKSRVVICLIIALIPLGNHAINTNLTYSIWHIFLISLLLIIAPLPKPNLLKMAQFTFIFLAVWSHPLSVIFIPICFALLFLRPSLHDRINNAAILIISILYILLGTKSINKNYQIGIENFFIAFQYIIDRVVFEPVFGDHLRIILQNANQSLVVNVFAFCILCGLCMVVLHLAKTKKLKLKTDFMLFICLSFGILVLSFIIVVTRKLNLESLYNPWAHRYFYIQQLFFIFLLITYVFRAIDWKILTISQTVFMFLFVSVYILYLNIHNIQFFYTSKKQGVETIEFLRYANIKVNSRNRDKSIAYISLPRGGRWDITINLDNKR